MSRCRYCNEEISWVRLRSGKAMPCEGDKPEVYHVHLAQEGKPMDREVCHRLPQVVLVTLEGDVLRGRVAPRSESGTTPVEGYESHFARCPGADEARRRDA